MIVDTTSRGTGGLVSAVWLLSAALTLLASPPVDAGKRTGKLPAPKRPVVTLTSPSGGWSSTRIVTVEGRIRPRSINRATLVVNGATTGIPVSGGSFSKKIVLSPGANTLRVVAASARGTGSRAVTVFSRVPGKDLKIVLTWDTPGTDVDLWVIDPKGVKCWYRRKRTRAGGTLDTDVTSGYGPETFTQARSLPGPYRIVAHYYSARGSAPTEVKVEVIQFEGTPRERRLVRRGVLHRSKQQLRVAVVSVR